MSVINKPMIDQEWQELTKQEQTLHSNMMRCRAEWDMARDKLPEKLNYDEKNRAIRKILDDSGYERLYKKYDKEFNAIQNKLPEYKRWRDDDFEDKDLEKVFYQVMSHNPGAVRKWKLRNFYLKKFIQLHDRLQENWVAQDDAFKRWNMAAEKLPEFTAWQESYEKWNEIRTVWQAERQRRLEVKYQKIFEKEMSK